MHIKWFGHSCFLITSRTGTRILTDPYDQSLKYEPPAVESDLVLVSHDHFDHNAVDVVGGSPTVVKGSGEFEGVQIHEIPTYHDRSEGADRGENSLYYFEIDGVHVAHLGDLGHALTNRQLEKLEDVDLAFVPTGGFYTIGPDIAAEIVEQMSSLKVAVPMHFKTDQLSASDFPLASAEEFTEKFDQVNRIGDSAYQFETLPESLEIWVFQYVGQD